MLDSFAHHPVEIAADIEAARVIAGDACRVLVVYQPRGHARTLSYADAAPAELAAADLVVLLDVCGGAGTEIPGVSSQLIADAGAGQVAAPGDAASMIAEAARLAARPGDVVLIMGSGPHAEQVVCNALDVPQGARA